MKRLTLLFCAVLMISSGTIMKGQTFFVHTTDTLNTFWNYSYFNNPFTNEAPDEKVFVTHNANPEGDEDIVFHDHTLGVWYDADKWSVFNEDESFLDTSISFNALVPSESDTAFIHIADTDNTFLSSTFLLNHPAIDENLNAIIIITQNWNLYGVYQTEALGIGYDTVFTPGRWAIFSEMGSSIPQYAAFNVMVADTNNYNAFVHTTTASNKLEYRTLIDHPDLNGNPDAIILITQVWNPDGNAYTGVTNPHEVGVQYLTAVNKWAIFNEDMAEMPDSASFNVVFKKEAEPEPEPDPDPVSVRNVQQENNYTTLNIYTNPDGNNLSIVFSLNASGSALLQVYSTDGQLVKTIANEIYSEGNHILNVNDLQLKSGYYLMSLKTKNGITTKAFPVIK
jgi:hypothetical protein